MIIRDSNKGRVGHIVFITPTSSSLCTILLLLLLQLSLSFSLSKEWSEGSWDSLHSVLKYYEAMSQ